MSIAEERQESRIRKRANRLGLSVQKDRAKYRSLNNRGLFRLINRYSNMIVIGERFDVSLEDIERFLNGAERKESTIDKISEELSVLKNQGLSPLEQAEGLLAAMERMGLMRRTGTNRKGQPIYAMTKKGKNLAVKE